MPSQEENDSGTGPSQGTFVDLHGWLRVYRQYGTDLPWIRLETFNTYDMTKEVNLSAPEFTLAQVETKISLMRMLKNSTEILIVIAKIAVVAIDNDVIRNSSDAW